MKKFTRFIGFNGIFMSFAVAIVAALCVGGLKTDNDAITITGICLGILLIIVIGIKEPVMFAVYKMRIRDFVEGVTQPFIRVNSVNWKVLELIPNVDKMCAKHIVYNRRHLGKYKSMDDFFNINQIAEDKREQISKYIVL